MTEILHIEGVICMDIESVYSRFHRRCHVSINVFSMYSPLVLFIILPFFWYDGDVVTCESLILIVFNFILDTSNSSSYAYYNNTYLLHILYNLRI